MFFLFAAVSVKLGNRRRGKIIGSVELTSKCEPRQACPLDYFRRFLARLKNFFRGGCMVFFATVFVKLNNRRRGKIPTATCGGIRRAVALLTISLGVLVAASEKALAQAQVTGPWGTPSYPMPINPLPLGFLHTRTPLALPASPNTPTKPKPQRSKP